MSLIATNAAPDFFGDICGTSPSLRTFVSSSVVSQSSTQTTIQVIFGFRLVDNYSDDQGFAGWLDGVLLVNDTLNNNKGTGGSTTNWKFGTFNKTYNRPAYGSAALRPIARSRVIGIFNGDGTSDTGDQYIDTTIPAVAGTVLGAPPGFYCSVANAHSLTFNWSLPPNAGIGPPATSYILQLATDPGFSGVIYSADVGPVGSASIAGLFFATTYYARVLAVNAVGNGAWSGTVAQATAAIAPSVPAAPVLNNPTTDGFRVNWSAPANNGSAITSYTIQVSSDDFATIAETIPSVSGSPYTVTGLTPGVSYKARVLAVNGIGPGSYSSPSLPIQTIGGVKVWNGTAWINGIMYQWNGTAWKTVLVEKWNGSSWVV